MHRERVLLRGTLTVALGSSDPGVEPNAVPYYGAFTETELATRNRRAGFPSPLRFAGSADEARRAARGPLQTAAAVQHRHGAEAAV